MIKILMSILMFSVLTCLLCTDIQAQQAPVDVITLMNGNEMKGKVTAINGNDIKFVYQGEELTYTVKKEEINKIQFSSGRVEIINDVTESEAAQEDSSGLPETQRNLVAVLPFSYLGEGGAKDEKLSKKVQSDCYNLLLKFAPHFSVQDPLKTNAYLARQGVNESNIDGFLPDELCHILGAEYVVIGSILVDYKGTTNYSNSSSESKKKDDGKKRTTYSSTSSSSTEQFETQVDLKIYTDDGHNISSQSRRSFWQTEDAYAVTLQYLIKRSPLYSK
ncbi:hypothetical protein [Mangrovibacterium lignilyticum]|uniref:hypothetical protein n=1 Tax=Mangrovibacterium lignilyticum TaxID=2668052 RepID=UPI0013D123F2|nr:hypothetical protein [Mangrovibacterium lignilyticum]